MNLNRAATNANQPSRARGFSANEVYFVDTGTKEVFRGDLGARAILAEAQTGRPVAYVTTNNKIRFIRRAAE